MSKSIDNLKYFLKEMFQFNENDLDFGIYKIYNLKRKHIESFIDGDGENDLAPTIEQIMKEVNLQTQKADAIDLYNFLKGKNMENLLNDPEANYEDIQLALNFEKDEDKKESLTQTLNNLSKAEGLTDELKDKIYNHILGFFQMYYSNGDFGYNDRSRDLYKVPYEADYNGSDTMFHWKHKGSLYIKTGTSFNAIKFDLNGKKIEYRLETNVHSEEEGTSQNNNKDSQLKHYRLDRIDKVKDKATNETIYQVIFNLSDASTSKVEIYKEIYKEIFSVTDIDKYLEYEKDGKTKQVFIDLTKDFDKVQNGQIKGLSALRQNKLKVEKEVKNNFDRGVRLYDEGTKEFTDATLKDLYSLDQKLNSFYIGNDADYFIHENLNEFLTNEKNRFVKNYIFDDLESIYNGKLDNTTLLIAKAFDKVSSRIIEFLSAIEDFQKHLFTKKKKVIESEYCITIDYIDEKYYEEILKNKRQLQEWENLFSLKVNTIEDLKANPTLGLDTRFYQQPDGKNPFKDKILSEIDDLDNNIDGLLINSENYQILELLRNKFAGKLKTIYVDPPYNTGGDSFMYKDNFKHSSWITMMNSKIQQQYDLLKSGGTVLFSIDNNEYSNLTLLLKHLLKKDRIDTLIWKKKAGGGDDSSSIATEHEYIIPIHKGEALLGKIDHESASMTAKYNQKEPNGRRYYWERMDKTSLTYSASMDYEVPCPDGTFIKPPQPDPKNPTTIWRWNKEKLFAGLKAADDSPNKVFIRKDKDGEWRVYTKTHISLDGVTPRSLLVDKHHGRNRNGTREIANIFGFKAFKNPKPIDLFNHLFPIFLNSKDDYVGDFFAGSGTTGNALLKLNRLDGGKRKYILGEMGSYFDRVTKPRIQKAIYSENWKKGKSLDNNGSKKHIFKYQVLEQYEDVLDNLQQYDGALPENLPLKYLYKPEENSLENTLNLFTPFSNKINYGQPTQQGFIDIVETYNYLQGYFIKTIKTYELGKKYYKVVETTIGVLVIWRDIAIDEDDSKAIIEIASKYPNIHTVEVNAEFATLNLDKGNHLKVNETEIELKIITKEVFNQ